MKLLWNNKFIILTTIFLLITILISKSNCNDEMDLPPGILAEQLSVNFKLK